MCAAAFQNIVSPGFPPAFGTAMHVRPLMGTASTFLELRPALHQECGARFFALPSTRYAMDSEGVRAQ